MVDIVTAMSAVGAAYESVKKVMAALTEAGKTELRLQVGELAVALQDAQMALAEAKKIADEKDQEIERLKQSFQRKADTVVFDGFRFTKGPDGKPVGRPFCPVCEEREGRLIMLQSKQNGGWRDLKCPSCKSDYLVESFRWPEGSEEIK